MYVRVYFPGGVRDQKPMIVDCRSINQLIDDLRSKVARKFPNQDSIEASQQPVDSSTVRLFLHGKELKNGYSLYDYQIKINDPIVALKNEESGKIQQQPGKRLSTAGNGDDNNQDDDEVSLPENDYYKLGDHIDALDPDTGAWFEARIVKISPLSYSVQFTRHHLQGLVARVRPYAVRPQSGRCLSLDDIQVGDSVLINYDVESNTKDRGFWYDLRVEKVSAKKRQLIGTLLIGGVSTDGRAAVANLKATRIWCIDEIYKIESNIKRDLRSPEDEVLVHFGAKNSRRLPPQCNKCLDRPTVRCKTCSCNECGGKNAPDKQIICDECDAIFHIWCLPQPLDQVPSEEDWYCSGCRNNDKSTIDRREEEQLEQRRKKLNRIGTKDWGRGVACMGRTKVCKSVPKDHFGPIPGVEVGTWWRFRLQASEAGVHTPLVAGIHGKENLGAYSIVFSCSYDEDIDLGNEFYYTASGGKELNTKCRVGGPQVKDQELKRCNKALAVCCYAEFNSVTGANAGLDWHKGKPVRVLRSGNARGKTKKSIYLPKIGVRYDGIYKVVKYWPQSGESGFLIWRFLMRRDDPAPAPWTSEGKNRARKLGLSLIYPPGWQEYAKGKKLTGAKENVLGPAKKKPKLKSKFMSQDIMKLIRSDSANEAVWQTLQQEARHCDEQEFFRKLEDAFKCACCLELVKEPVTTGCKHNICKECLVHSLSSGVESCPTCRCRLHQKHYPVNKSLQQILSLVK